MREYVGGNIQTTAILSPKADEQLRQAALVGLSMKDVEDRRSRGLGNTVQAKSGRSYLQIVRENIFTFINCLLFGIGITLIALGRVSDALVSVGVIMFNMVVGLIQELRAKRTLDRISLLTRPKATVIREGTEYQLDPAEIVVGDVLVVRPGDQFVVDGQCVSDGQMSVDESLLTGESQSIRKHKGDPVYSGSFCISGYGCYEAQKIGLDSLANQMTLHARTFQRVYTPLQNEINLIVRVLVAVTAYYGLMLGASAILNDIPLVASVQMAAVIAKLIPNGLFMTMTLAYALGAVRIAKKGALVQHMNAVESLSNVTVLCLDKTGTLTTNALKLDALYPIGMTESDLRCRLGAYAASTPAANRTLEAIGAACHGTPQPVSLAVPFSSVQKWSAIAFADALYVLGAADILAPYAGLCAETRERIHTLSAQGLRVLLFATGPVPATLFRADGQPQLPPTLTACGLISIRDELRPEAQETLRAYQNAGIILKIISGDNPATVIALARQAGFAPDLESIDGAKLETLTEVELAQTVKEVTVFGRITPQQKERIVRAFRAQGAYVAMIGDGVNDVLALKQANLGIALESGSQAARAVSGIVLLQDSFAALPRAFAEGRRIRNGMQTMLKLFMTRILFDALILVSLAVIGVGFPFTPKQGSLAVLLTVGIPVLGLTLWAESGPVAPGGLLRGLPRFVLPAAFTLTLMGLGVFVGYVVTHAETLKTVVPALSEVERLAQSEPIAQTALVTFVVFCGLLLIPFLKPPARFWASSEPVSADWRPTILALAILASYIGILCVPFLREFFELALLPVVDYVILGGLAVVWALVVRGVWQMRLVDHFLSRESPGRCHDKADTP